MWIHIDSHAIEINSFYKEEFKEDNELFVYTFRSVGEMILYMNSIFNAIVYFYTNTELQKEVQELDIVKRTTIKLNSMKTFLSS